jgi:hypothetical protein
MKMLADKLQHLAIGARELLWPDVSTPAGLRHARIWAIIGAASIAWHAFHGAEVYLSASYQQMTGDLGHLLSVLRPDDVANGTFSPGDTEFVRGFEFREFSGVILEVVLLFVLSVVIAFARSIIGSSLGLLITGALVIFGAIELEEVDLGLYAFWGLAFLGAIQGLRSAIATRRAARPVTPTPTLGQNTMVPAQVEPQGADVRISPSATKNHEVLYPSWEEFYDEFSKTTVGRLFFGWWLIWAGASTWVIWTRYSEYSSHISPFLSRPSFIDIPIILWLLACLLGGPFSLTAGLVSLTRDLILLGARSFRSIFDQHPKPDPANGPPPQDRNGAPT